MAEVIEIREKNKRDCPAGDSFMQTSLFFIYLLVFSIIAIIYYFSQGTIKIKEIFSMIALTIGLSSLLTGVCLSLVYTIFNFNKYKGGFGLYFWIGAFLSVWGILLGFMQKVG